MVQFGCNLGYQVSLAFIPPAIWFNSLPGGDQLTAWLRSSPEYARDTVTDLMIQLQNQSMI